GEKSRLALALIVWQKPNLLLLDEPTNHLDLEMRHALTVALQGFDGAMVLVSHDRHLAANTIDEFYTVHRGALTEFDGDLDDYARWLQDPDGVKNSSGASPDNKNNRAAKAPSSIAVIDKKDQRKQAAAAREQLAPLRREIRTLEQKIEKLSKEIAGIEEKLGDTTLYEESRRNELTELLRQQGYCKAELGVAEESWLEKSTELEELSG
ncbi:MAG: ABC transporter ATP-binding protein, partial [Gammaproteobacteria bacterium]|nr:ABC transporter ATP-binding protein [Gammaproteobacteria bacterium]